MLLRIFCGAILFAANVRAAPYWKRDAAFAFGSDKVQGANLGGWLVLEPWITPSLFQPQDGSVVDEYTFTKQVSNAADLLQQHWKSWVTQKDLQRIKDAGFNTVRIPIGYWAFKKYHDDPYIMGAQDYLDQGIEWARQIGLKVWVDLHGAPLSQNGQDNSGQMTDSPGWTSDDSVAATEEVLGMIAQKYAQPDYQDVVVAIELLNEPNFGLLPAGARSATTDYYNKAYQTVRSVSNTPVFFSDGFDSPSSWNGIPAGSSGVGIDHHDYQVFTNEGVALSPQAHNERVCTSAQTWASGVDKWVVVGEWTAAMTDCAPALNGYKIGARYEGTYSKRRPDGTYDTSTFVGNCTNKNFIDQWTDDMKSDTQKYIETQLNVFEQHAVGWIFWNFKTEAAAEWDLFKLLDYGLFPQPLSSRKYGLPICSF